MHRFDLPANGAADGVGFQDWGSWIDDPMPLLKMTTLKSSKFFNAQKRIQSHDHHKLADKLFVGMKVVVAVAGAVLESMHRNVLAFGGDSGSLLIATFRSRITVATSLGPSAGLSASDFTSTTAY